MRKIYLISVLVLIAVTLVGCGSTEVVCENAYPIEISLEGSTEPETAAPTVESSFSAGSELFSETSLKSETVAEAETTAVTEAVPVEIPHTVATEPQTEVYETTYEIIETYPPTTESATTEPIPTPTEKTEETTAYPETTTDTANREEIVPLETTRETDHQQTTRFEETPPQTEFTETTTETTVEPIPEPVKTPYDAPFDIEQIKAELIALGESMGMTHRIAYKDGEVITPDNSSWELPITANSSFCGGMLKRSLHDYVLSYAEYHLYGGEPITHFTIYVLPLSDGYEIYFLH